jgi:hypothetical protein
MFAQPRRRNAREMGPDREPDGVVVNNNLCSCLLQRKKCRRGGRLQEITTYCRTYVYENKSGFVPSVTNRVRLFVTILSLFGA